jgi:hypothetical protein
MDVRSASLSLDSLQAYKKSETRAPKRSNPCPECLGTKSHRDRGVVAELCPAALEKKRTRQRDWFRERYQTDWRFRALYLLGRRKQRRAVADAKDQAVIDEILVKHPELKAVIGLSA